jgi:hypothetical protein
MKYLFPGIVSILFLLNCFTLKAQEDLLGLLGEDEVTTFTTATFKSTRIINSQSIENAAKGVLDIKIQHRFTSIDRGIGEFFGLDGATIRIGGDYGVTNKIMIGLGRSTLDKAVDGFVKIKLLRQSSGKRNMPFSLSWFSAMEIKTTKFGDETRNNYFSSRLYYSHQLLIARKFSDGLSIQIMPTLLHRNLIKDDGTEKNDVYSIGIGFRQKLSKRTSFNVEYFYTPEGQISGEFKNPLSIGFDIETGGHVFQLHFTNAMAMIYKGFIGETTDSWSKGQIHFGFNLSRVFTIVKPKESEQ